MNPAKVEVERFVTARLVTVVVPKEAVLVPVMAPPKNEEPLVYALPCTLSNDDGLVVPMPTEPLSCITKRVVLAISETANA